MDLLPEQRQSRYGDDETLFQVTGDEAYADVARGTLRYVLRDMTDPEGGFFSAEDADSMPFEGASEKKEVRCGWDPFQSLKLMDFDHDGGWK